MQPFVDVQSSTITDGEFGAELATYSLEKRRSWNFGYRKHMRELTGRIIVTFRPHQGEQGHAVCDDWAEVKRTVLRVYAQEA